MSLPHHFDPADPGSPEDAWQAFLATQPEWQAAPSSVLVIGPHPDDEVLGAGGLMYSLAQAGCWVRVLSVTDGEAAYPGMMGLARLRRRELRLALRQLIPWEAETVRLGLPDGGVCRYVAQLRASIDSLIRSGMLIVAPFEKDGHCDHEAVGRVAHQVARARRIAIVRYPIWAWHRLHPNEVRRLGWRRFVLTEEAQRAKARAVDCFRSQIAPDALEPMLPPHVLRYFQRSFEAFV